MSVPVTATSPQHYSLAFPHHHLHGGQRIGLPHRMHASLDLADGPWGSHYRSASLSISSPHQSSSMFSHAASGMSYPSPALSSHSPSFLDHASNSGLQPSPIPSHDADSVPLSFSQVESSIGPSRVQTRGQRRAALDSHLGRRVSAPSSFNRPNSSEQNSGLQRAHSGVYLTPPGLPSRPQTPSNASDPTRSPSQRERSSLSMPHMISPQMQHPAFPATPDSTAYSPYGYYASHSRSNSTSTSNPRSASPALSTVTSVSSASASNTQTFVAFTRQSSDNNLSVLAPPRHKQRKQRLFNVDRKAICQYHKDNPNARQEDIALRYGVERSTISKILKHKTKWLNVPSDEEMRVAKHRPSKFPEVEEQMVKWLSESDSNRMNLSDNTLRSRARDIARDLNIGEDKFKASSGWVENFKHRHGIRAGVWSGEGKNTLTARAVGAGTLVDDGGDSPSSSMNHLAYDGHAEMMDDIVHDDSVAIESEESSSSGPQINDQDRLGQVQLRPAFRPAWPETNSVDLSGNDPGMVIDQSKSDAGPSLSHSPHVPQHAQHAQSDSAPQHSATHEVHPPHDQQQQQQHQHQHQQHPPPPEPIHSSEPPLYASPPQIYSTTTIEGVPVYETIPAIPDNRTPTLEEAELHMNKLLLFFDTTGRGIIGDEDRRNLHQVKFMLFQAASGVPYTRES